MEIKEVNIPDYGIVKVSEYGDVWGVHDYSKKRKLKVDKDGYLRLQIKYRRRHFDENGKECFYRGIFIHRLVAEAFLPNPDNLPVVNHKDGNKQNNHYSNLEWCTVKYNNHHAIITKLYKGISEENNPKNKLTKEEVLEIRKEHEISLEKGYKFYDKYAEKYGVSRETIRHICQKKTWKNI